MDTLTLYDFQVYWWILISLLGAALAFLLFVQGGQTLLYTIAKNETERNLLVNALGKKWELTFTTLVTFGGAFFAAFPLFYATSFGGAYWLWMFILFGFILQAVSYEFRRKPNNFLGQKTFEYFLLTNGILATVLIGVAVGGFFTGNEFYINKYNLSQWNNSLRGLESIVIFQNLLLGLTVFFLARCNALMFFINRIDYNKIWERSVRQLKGNATLFLLCFLLFALMLLTQTGFTTDPMTKTIGLEKYKYTHNLIEMPIAGLIFLIGAMLVLLGIYVSLDKNSRRGIWFSGGGTIAVVFSLFLIAGLNNTPFYPSTSNIDSSLTIENASSSLFTLKTMTYVSFFLPLVIAYIWYSWYAMTKKKINELEVNDEKNFTY
ncbi:MAG: cytochrome d ubiquinol oxidase subunit II [Bacteroidales bacterium]|nr:cytochrome d ubiquinol oxidase subunit II [Bacteroidales bacterium]